ncbi:condensation protein [Streptomyces sp. GS7]|uniref:condensation protein n=1 Tax=Streptomyces sp. GS7 TaxID=2692234 RepID=UPI0013175963|nr:condensation protein [Streptomyces sp. GS7]QHC21235.1 condensation protein [Streptomyces sp. GS7]
MTALQPAPHDPPSALHSGPPPDSPGGEPSLAVPDDRPGEPPGSRSGTPSETPDSTSPGNRAKAPRAALRTPAGLPPAPQLPTQPTIAHVPFPVVDEISRHCLADGEPETVHIEVHLPRPVDHCRLRTAFHQALALHPRILMRQAPAHWWHRRYTWQLTATPDVDPVSFPPPGPDALERARERALTHCPPLHLSPPVRLEVVEHTAQPGASAGTVLLLTINHTALDGPACLRVLATTAELYGGADNSPAPPPVRAPGPTPTSRHPAPDHPDPNGATPPTGRTHPLTRPARITPHHISTGTGSGTGTGTGSDVICNGTSNGMLLTELPVPARPPRTADAPPPYTVNDQLLVATCLMAARWNRLHGRRTAPVVVTMPVDDRPRGTEMPIGNGTRLVSVDFGPDAERRDAALLTADPPDPAALSRLLHHTATRTRALKSAPGPQLGLSGTLLTTPALPVGLRAALTRTLRSAAAPWTSTTLLSNIGRIPYPLDFGDAGRATAVWFSAPARMPRGVTVTTVSVGNRIQLALRWSHALLDAPAANHLAALFRSSLAATAHPAPPTTPPAPTAPEGGAR